MKYLLTACVFLLMLKISYAQEDNLSRPLVLGGTLHFSTQKNTSFLPSIGSNIGSIGGISNLGNEDPKETRLFIRPYLGIQFTNSFLAGLLLDAGISRYSSTIALFAPQPSQIDFERHGEQYGIGLFTRHSFIPDARFDFFIQPYAQYYILSEEEFRNNETFIEEKANFFTLGFDLGVLYNISDKWRATVRMGGIRYINGSWERENTDLGEEFNSFGLNLSLSTIQFGVEMLL